VNIGNSQENPYLCGARIMPPEYIFDLFS